VVLPISESRRASQVMHAIVRTRSVLLLLQFIAAEIPLFICCRLADIEHRRARECYHSFMWRWGSYVYMYIFVCCRNSASRARPADVGAAAAVTP
jgi:hypothetical protein